MIAVDTKDLDKLLLKYYARASTDKDGIRREPDELEKEHCSSLSSTLFDFTVLCYHYLSRSLCAVSSEHNFV